MFERVGITLVLEATSRAGYFRSHSRSQAEPPTQFEPLISKQNLCSTRSQTWRAARLVPDTGRGNCWNILEDLSGD